MPLTLALGNSPRFTGLLAIGGGLAQFGFWSLPGLWAGITAAIGGIYLFQQWWLHIGRQSRRSVVAIRWVSRGQWQVQFREGQWSESMRLMPGSFCHPLLVLFRLIDLNGRRYALVIPGDSVESEPFRRLRVKILQASRDDPAT